jgi:hypothetical protein
MLSQIPMVLTIFGLHPNNKLKKARSFKVSGFFLLFFYKYQKKINFAVPLQKVKYLPKWSHKSFACANAPVGFNFKSLKCQK